MKKCIILLAILGLFTGCTVFNPLSLDGTKWVYSEKTAEPTGEVTLIFPKDGGYQLKGSLTVSGNVITYDESGLYEYVSPSLHLLRYKSGKSDFMGSFAGSTLSLDLEGVVILMKKK